MSDERQEAMGIACRALSARDRTVAEVAAKLGEKGFEQAVVEEVLDELRADGMLDDERFAARFAEDKRALELWGTERIERELGRRGVPAQLVEAVAWSQREEMQQALDLLARRMPAMAADDRERDRAWRMLVRKGYSAELAYEAVRSYGREQAA